MRKAVLLLALVMLCGTGGAAHITDKLVVGLYPDQKLQGEPKQLLTSGTPIEVLKRGKGVVEVRLADDTRGWIEARYVSEEKPAAMKLLEAQAELRRLKRDLKGQDVGKSPAPVKNLPSVEQVHAGLALNEAKARITELEAALTQLPKLRAAAKERDELKARLAKLRKLLGVKAETTVVAGGSEAPFWERYLPWLVAAGLALLGFAAGIVFIDYRIRRRYGGFRLR